MSLPTGPDRPPGGVLVSDAVLRGAGVTAVLCGPLALINSLAQSGKETPSPAIGAAFSLLILSSAALGGWVAGRRAPGRTLPNGAAAAAAGYLVIQALGLVVAASQGTLDALSLVGVAYLTLLMSTCGLLGGALANRRNHKEYLP